MRPHRIVYHRVAQGYEAWHQNLKWEEWLQQTYNAIAARYTRGAIVVFDYTDPAPTHTTPTGREPY